MYTSLAVQERKKKAEHVQRNNLMQALIIGTCDEKTRKNLLSEKRALSWDKACSTAHDREAVKKRITQLRPNNSQLIQAIQDREPPLRRHQCMPTRSEA